MSARQEEEARRMKAYSVASSDEEAAGILGLNVKTFKSWRQQRKLSGYKDIGRPMKSTAINLDQVRRMLPR